MSVQRFEAEITREGSRAWIILPFDPDAVWGPKERHYVAGAVGPCRFRGCVERIEGRSVLPVGPAWLRDSGLTPGARVEVELSPEGPQLSNMAPDITEALQANPAALGFFDSLATFYRKNFIRWIESAKRPETRQNRIREMIQLLSEGRRER